MQIDLAYWRFHKVFILLWDLLKVKPIKKERFCVTENSIESFREVRDKIHALIEDFGKKEEIL